MPHFFFNVRNGENFTEDKEGNEYSDLYAAKAEARKSALEIVSALSLIGSSPDAYQFEIVEEGGKDIAVVRFIDAIASQAHQHRETGIDPGQRS